MSSSKRGGKRPGAGRKPKAEGTQKLAYATKLAPVFVRYLKSRDNAAGTIEATLGRSKEYREWAKGANDG